MSAATDFLLFLKECRLAGYETDYSEGIFCRAVVRVSQKGRIGLRNWVYISWDPVKGGYVNSYPPDWETIRDAPRTKRVGDLIDEAAAIIRGWDEHS